MPLPMAKHLVIVIISILLCLLISRVHNEAVLSEADVEQYTTNLINELLPKGYNKNLRPHYGGRAMHVNISILINDISAISETEMQYKVDFNIRHYWNDHRLSFPVKHNVSSVTLGEDFVKKIWLPDSSFDNAKEVNVHKTFYSESTTLFRIKSNGDILYSTRIALVAQCPMDLTFFPLDQQKCSIEISSYGLLTSEMIYRWSEKPSGVEISSKIDLPTFRLVGFNKFTVDEVFSTGVYSQVRCDIFLVRSIGYYVSQVYIPALLIVIISWLPFWLDRNDHHARVALGVTTVLTMTTLTTSSSSDFPKISYLKAIDVYLFTSFLMVFLSLIEYAVVGYYEYKMSIPETKTKEADKLGPDSKDFRYDADDPKNIKLMQMSTIKRGEYLNNNFQPDGNQVSPCSEKRRLSVQSNASQETAKRSSLIKDTSLIDQWARWIFPGTFIAFNIIYIFVLSLLVSINSKHEQIQVKM